MPNSRKVWASTTTLVYRVDTFEICVNDILSYMYEVYVNLGIESKVRCPRRPRLVNCGVAYWFCLYQLTHMYSSLRRCEWGGARRCKHSDASFPCFLRFDRGGIEIYQSTRTRWGRLARSQASARRPVSLMPRMVAVPATSALDVSWSIPIVMHSVVMFCDTNSVEQYSIQFNTTHI